MAAPVSSLAERRLNAIRRLIQLQKIKEQRDVERLRGVDVFAEIGYVPTPKQQMFHDATEYSILFGGAAGGGKSRAAVAEGIRACVRYPGIRVGVFRRTYGELRESVLAELAELGFAQAVGGVWNGSSYELRFPNKSLLMFRYAETLMHATRRQGGQYQLLIFDEMTLTQPEVVSFLESRLRSANPEIPVLGMRGTANPGGPGHGYVRARFIDSTNYGADVITDKRGRTVRFIPSKLEDNPHLNPEYYRDLDALPEIMRRAMRDGDWSVFAGMMFPELMRERHVVEPMTLPATWKRYCGIDWGYSNPWAVIWGAVDEDGRVWCYREIYKSRVGEKAQAERILEAERTIETLDDGTTREVWEAISGRYADDAMWATRGDARPISDIYADNGCHLTPAGKGGRVAGWQRVRTYLDDGPACPHHRAMGWETCPRIHFFPTLYNTFTELSNLPHAEKGDPEDADTDAADHLCDALRYMLLNLGAGPQFPILGEDRDPGGLLTPVVPEGSVYAMRPRDTSGLLTPADLTVDPDDAWRVY